MRNWRICNLRFVSELVCAGNQISNPTHKKTGHQGRLFLFLHPSSDNTTRDQYSVERVEGIEQLLRWIYLVLCRCVNLQNTKMI